MTPLQFRPATADDLPEIVAMLADDMLGRDREDPSLPLDRRYRSAFQAIQDSPNILLTVAVEDGRVIGVLQLVLIPALSRKGGRRGLIEGVRIASDRRGRGLGEQLVRWAIAECQARGCVTVQLTTDNSRLDAHRFYARLGFKQSHLGFKHDLAGGAKPPKQ